MYLDGKMNIFLHADIRRYTLALILNVVITLLFTGCMTTNEAKNSQFTSKRSIKEADRFFELEEYRAALTQYSGYLYSPFTNKEELPYVRYKVGFCHYLLGQYDDAYLTFKTLLDNYPQYQYASEARELMQKCENKIKERNQQFAQEQNSLIRKIQQFEKFVKESPDNPNYHFQLGNLFWDAGYYQKAIDEYAKAATLDPTFLEEGTLRQRVRITERGEFVLRDPILDYDKQEPVRVTRLDKEIVRRRNSFLGDFEAIRVSGTVENEGLQDVSYVYLEVTIYDFYDSVQGTQVVQIGRLNAGGDRKFSVMFNQFSGMAIDIRKVTAKVFYD